jgi:Diguanylate cyclase, GGDEF domain
LKKALRTSDSAFRIGGDEFALLLPQTDAEQSLALSRRIETVFGEMLEPLQLAVSVSMDHGVATFPQDGEHADQLIRVADERLYRLKHANHGRSGNGSTRTETVREPVPQKANERPSPPPEPISIDSKRPTEHSEEKEEKQNSAGATVPPAAEVPSTQPPSGGQAPRMYTIQRKAERVSMAGTNAYAVLGEQGARRARVIDLGFGGVAIELDTDEQLPESVLAVLHVPILPPVRVSLKPVWSQRTTQGNYRVGCAFVS